MIPKKIHYFWVGDKPMPEKNKACAESWKKFCPDYEIIEWNESNYDFSVCTYMAQAYEAKMWAFVPDYARLDIIYREGGIYLDTDVELLKSLDSLLNCKAFLGFESQMFVALGLGFGAEPGNEILKQMRDLYHSLSFYKEDGTTNIVPSPFYTTELLKSYGLQLNGKYQSIQGIDIFPAEYFAPLCFTNNRLKITQNTYSIHWYHASWHTPEQKERTKRIQKINRIFGQRLGRIIAVGYFTMIRAKRKIFRKK
ncbi:MAG: glycosyl transferase [Lachnospiraceae bacterium]|jgi:mannosyltransferase OCH1-like enzyme|nr:glycosyl transferase [Lachnospiraceae bacterium]